jgi:hypothetical protein
MYLWGRKQNLSLFRLRLQGLEYRRRCHQRELGSRNTGDRFYQESLPLLPCSEDSAGSGHACHL